MSHSNGVVSENGVARVKVSQRPSRSCTECIRRKNRCNKSIPCDVCVKRNVPHLCRLEELYQPIDAAIVSNGGAADGNSGIILKLIHELEVVKRRLDKLEGKQSDSASGSKRRRVETASDLRGNRSKESTAAPEDLKPEDTATTLEFFALGLDRRLGQAGQASTPVSAQVHGSAPSAPTPCSHILPVPADRPFPESIVDALLPESNIDAILHFAQTHGLWQHCCVLFPRFHSEVQAFREAVRGDEGWTRVEPTWVAVLYALLGITVHQMSSVDALACGLGNEDRLVLPNAFIAAAEEALHWGQFLSKPTIWTVQAIAMLTLCGHNVCESDLLSSLLAVGIKTAQTLRLHMLGGALRGKDISREKIQEVELGKRLWWSLAQEDWFGLPFRDTCLIHPDQFDTPMPFNCHDDDLQAGRHVDRGNGELTVAFKQRFSSHVALIVRDVFSQLRRPKDRSPFSIARDAETQIQSLLRSLPPDLQTPNSSSSAPSPTWSRAMRHYLSISANHKSIIIFRAALARGGTSNERLYAQKACISAAEAIVDEIERGGGHGDGLQSIWTIPYHGLAAAVVLALDMCKVGDEEVYERRKAGVEKARMGLERLSPTSRIARRGLQVIDGLLREIPQLRRDQGPYSPDAMLKVVQKLQLPVNDTIHTGTSTAAPSQNASPSNFDMPDSYSNALQPSIGVDPSYGAILPTTSDNQDLLWDLHQNVPDVARLFDGSLGIFDWTTM